MRPYAIDAALHTRAFGGRIFIIAVSMATRARSASSRLTA